MLYPTWKIADHWTVSGAIDVSSRPYFRSGLLDSGLRREGLCNSGESRLLECLEKGVHLSARGAVTFRAFGAFLLRYDDADNPLP